MKNSIKIVTIFVFSLCIFFCLGCQNGFMGSDINAGEGEGQFVLSIGKGSGGGRTIMPPAITDPIAVYTLQFSSDAGALDPIDRTSANISEPINLHAGTYSLIVTAYTDAGKTNPVARGTIEGIVITAGGSTSKSLVLGGVIEEGATGTFKWKISFPGAATASMTITPLNQSGTPQQTKSLTSGTTDSVTLNTGYYRVTFYLDNGERAVSRENYLHIYKNRESYFEFAFTEGHFVTYIVSSESDNGDEVNPIAGSLRYVIKNAADYSTIMFADDVKRIELLKRLYIGKSLNIMGDGLTITKNDAWSDNTGESQLMYIYREPDLENYGEFFPSPEVHISRVHFTGGRSTMGGAIYNYEGELWLESCIFSDNRSIAGFGGAIYHDKLAQGLAISGCTFYGNSSNQGNAIYSGADEGYISLTGNVFYANGPFDVTQPEIAWIGGLIEAVSGGYNVADGEYGDLERQLRRVETTPTDKSVETPVIAPLSFKVLVGGEAANIIGVLPADYPETDFFGNTITNGASAGAIQAFGAGFALNVSATNDARGSAIITAAPNEDGLYSGEVTIMATPQGGSVFIYWLKNGVKDGTGDSLTYTPAGHDRIEAVFALLVDSAADTATAGTLRYALSNVVDGETISIDPALSGAITIGTPLPAIEKKNITIEGNGAVLTASAASQLLKVSNDDGVTVIRRLHFKDGRAAQGGAISNSGKLVLESCIFSGNQSTGTGAADGGGAIYNSGTLAVTACTFYQNTSAAQGGAVYQQAGALTLTGNLFYGNTGGTAVHRAAGTVVSEGFNAFDGTQNGWTTEASDKGIGVPFISTAAGGAFKLLRNSAAAGIIAALPTDYPSTDFYGDAIAAPAAAGAVQSAISSNGFALEYAANDPARGTVTLSGGPADSFGLYTGNITLTAAKTGAGSHEFVGWSVNGVMEETGSLTRNFTMSEHYTVLAIFGVIVNKYDVDDTSAGTFRAALNSTAANDYIYFKNVTPGVTTITLTSELPYITNRSVTIEGNGVTITKGAAYTTSTSSRLLVVSNSSAANTVRISRVHFKDGELSGAWNNGNPTGHGAAIYCTSNLILESCIFSNNRAGANYGNGGAIYLSNTAVNLELYGCTFYGNTSGSYGGAICSESTSTARRWVFAGNVFNANKDYVGSSSERLYTIALNANPTWTTYANLRDDGNSWFSATSVPGGIFVSPVSFKPIAGGAAVGMLTSLPAGYPTKDFLGNAITLPAAAGAIQSTVSGGYGFSLLQSNGGTVAHNGIPDAEGLYSGTITVTATLTAPEVVYWLVNGEKVENGLTTLTVTMDASKTVQPVFGISVTSGADSGPGTLRQAVTDIPAGLTIAVKVNEILLDSQISAAKDYTIQGNGVVIRPSTSWTGENAMLNIPYSSNPSVTIYNVHFKGANYGAITVNGYNWLNNSGIGSYSGSVSLNSCIFSENTGRTVTASGCGNVYLTRCTFYNNNAGSETVLLNQGRSQATSSGITTTDYGSCQIMNCLFYGNYGDAAIRLLSYYAAERSYVYAYYNVVDVPYGTAAGQAGWNANYSSSGTSGNITTSGNRTLSEMGITGAPFDTVTFRPVSSALNGVGAVNY